MTRPAPLCAFVVKGNRFCRSWSAFYGDAGKTYCATHARKVGAFERMLRDRRALYSSNGRAGRRRNDGTQELPERKRNRMAFLAKATVAREEGEEWVLPDEDEYEAIVERIEEFPTVKYQTTEPTIHARIVYRITEEGEFEGATADSIYNPSLNEKAKLYPVFKAITGITPDPGKSYDLEDHLVGKPCRILIEHRVSDRGGRFAGVSTVLPVRRKKAAATSVKQRLQVEDDDDLDLEDA